MTYQRERDQFVAQATADGLDLPTIDRLLRHASTLQRLAVAQCNGDYPCDNGERKVIFCPRCGSGFVRSAFRTANDGSRVCVDCRTQELVTAVLPAGVSAVFGGDPRGAVLVLATPAHPYDESGRNGARGLYVPARER